jgi:hypothetical protein
MIEEYSSLQILDFRQLWTQQTVPKSLLHVITIVAKGVFDVIVTPDSGLQNVTEWCKKELCWKRAAQLEINVDIRKVLGPLLIHKEEDRELQKTSKMEQRIGSGIEMQRFVLELGPAYWTGARKWAREQSLSTPDEDSILAVASVMPRKIPTEKQSWRLIQIKDKLELEGFPRPETKRI